MASPPLVSTKLLLCVIPPKGKRRKTAFLKQRKGTMNRCNVSNSYN